MPRLTKRYLAAVRALPWPEVLNGLGLTAPKHDPTSGGFFMRCHDTADHTPSLRFRSNGTFHCFACGASGDAFSFALRYLAYGGHRETASAADPFEGGMHRPKTVHTAATYRRTTAHFTRRHGVR